MEEEFAIRIETQREKNEVLRIWLAELRKKRKGLLELEKLQTKKNSLAKERFNASCLRQQQALIDFRAAVVRKEATQSLLKLALQWNSYDCFRIWHRGPFVTMNGLRLGAEATYLLSEAEITTAMTKASTVRTSEGRRQFLSFTNSTSEPSSPTQLIVPTSTVTKVAWNEINAALGFLALLLSVLEQKPHSGIKYQFEIVYQGSTSKIGVRRGESLTLYNLHSDDGFQFFGKRSFNTAIQCLVQCVMDAAESIQKRDPTISLPHAIERPARGEFTIGGLLLSFGVDGTEWTRAMKYLLTDVKQLMVFRGFGMWDP